MKLNLFFLTPAAALALLFQTASAATFTITPAAISNTFSGVITLNITNIPTGSSVVVQKFLDANTNGLIDAGDPLVQQFTLTDGTNFVIGGITNFNVPGDLNSATGAITTTLNYPNGDFVQTIVGKYLYRFSSAAGTVTNVFSVTNFPFPQKFTGTVVSNNAVAVVSNAFVLLFPPPRPGESGPGSPIAGAVANNSGVYTIAAPVGIYTVMAFKSNYVTLSKKAPLLALGSGQTVTTNLLITNTTTTISGKIVDAANNSIGLPGLFMPFQSTNGLIALAFTDTNGNFTAHVTAGGWGFGNNDSSLIVHGYVGWNNKTNVNAGASGLTFPIYKANALFYGTLKDTLGNPIPGIDMSASDTTSNLFYMDSYTRPDGTYQVGLVAGGAGDPWLLQIGNGYNLNSTNYVYSQSSTAQQNGGVAMSAGQSLEADVLAIAAPNHIVGQIQDSNGTNLVGLGVFAYATINGTNFFPLSVDTDTNGNYAMNVPNGSWTVSVNCNGGSDSLANLGNYSCPNSESANISNNNSTNNFTVQVCGGIAITTPPLLPLGEVGMFYDQFLQASSCAGGFNWSQTGGNTDGLGLAGNGELSGTPSSAGVFNFTAQVTDAGSLQTNKLLTLVISNALGIVTSALPNGTNGLSYNQTLVATGGVPFNAVSPYSWSLISGSLPPNLNLATNGVISGTNAATGLFGFTAQVADALGATFVQPLSINIVSTNNNAPPPPLVLGGSGGQFIVGWPASGSNYVLQMTTNLATGPWVPASNGVQAISFIFTNNGSSSVFFRLH